MIGENPTAAELELPDSGGSDKPYGRGDDASVFFGGVADGIVRSLRPGRVFDTGGTLVELLRARGVEARGPERSITEPLEGRFDLVTCIDAIERLPEQEARAAVKQISQASGAILSSSACWLKLFAEHGFEPDLNYDAGFVGPHAMLFRRRGSGAADRIAQLEAEAATERRRATRLAFTASELKGRLQAIQESPGWRLVTGYRNWLRVSKMRHRLVSRWFEPLAAWLLRSLAPESVEKESPQRTVLEEAAESSTPYEEWIQLAEPSPEELNLQRRRSAELAWRPKFSVLVPIYKVSQAVLADMIESVLIQTYDHWELCIVHGDPSNTAGREYLSALAASDARIKLELLESNLGISGNSNRALLQCEGDFIALLDHDDTLAPFALFEVAQRLSEDPALDFVYSDEDHLSEDGTRRSDPVFKPGWTPDRLLSANYITHLCAIRAALVREIGGWRGATDGAQDWDLFLRAAAESPRIAHIPKVLYHWRRVSTSVAAHGLKAKPYAGAAQLEVIRLCLEERGSNARPFFTPEGLIRLKWDGTRRPRATLVVLSATPLNRPVKHTGRYPGLEVIPVVCEENVSPAFRLNEAVRRSSGEVLVFLDESVEPAAGNWLDELIAPLKEPGAGIAGAKLLDRRTCRIFHAGICFNPDGELAYPFTVDPDYLPVLFNGEDWYNNWLAVSGACFGIRREIFDRVGGFSEEPMYPRLDVDLCLKAGLEAGQRVLYNPFASMWQTGPGVLERWVRKDGAAEGARYIRSSFPDGDPFFNPNLVCREEGIVLRRFGHGQALAESGRNFAAEARLLVKAYDCTPNDVKESKDSCSRHGGAPAGHFMWFLPEFRHAFSGGIHTILRLADYFRRAHGIRSTLVVLGHAHPARIRDRIAEVSLELASASAIEVVGDYGGLSRLEPSDAAIATAWSAAYFALRYNQARRKFYLLQDDESLLYPAGSGSALVEATWGFGFSGICGTETLRDLYAGRGGDAGIFTPCVDREVFYPRAALEPDLHRPHTLLCHTRPDDTRSCFELAMETIRILKRRLGGKVTIVTVGEEWEPADFGVQGLVCNLGPLGYRATGALYRSCDVGAIMTNTAHPALELMACGSLVVANQNPGTAWLLRNGDNCLLSGATPSALAEAVEEGLANSALRCRITENAGRMVRERYQDWDRSAEKVFRHIVGTSGLRNRSISP